LIVVLRWPPLVAAVRAATLGGVDHQVRTNQWRGKNMSAPEPGSDRLGRSSTRSAPTVLKALMREWNWHSYPMFKRAYEKAARRVDPALVSTFPSERTLKRWVAGRTDLPCAN
jgi:hypothetical protein